MSAESDEYTPEEFNHRRTEMIRQWESRLIGQIRAVVLQTV
jgi:hypothetical protein